MSALALQSFGFGDQLVRAVDRSGVAWFIAADVCGALSIANVGDAVGRLEEDERDTIGTTDSVGRSKEMVIISESGVYALVFTSRKEAAKRFRRWVTQEVLPAIRTTGRYEIANDPVAPEPTELLADETERLRLQLNLVREARIAFGTRGARRAWAIAGLPDLGLAEAAPILSVGAAVIGRLHQSVADWLDARTEAAPGHRVSTMVLYRDYLDWAKSEAVSPNEVVTLTSFGKAMTNCGLGSIRANVVYRIGLRLID